MAEHLQGRGRRPGWLAWGLITRRGTSRVGVPMALPETDVARVRRWVERRNEEIGEFIGEMRVELDVDARAITIFECRPPWREDFGPEWIRQEVARLRFTQAADAWTLYWPDRNGRFHRYDGLESTARIDRLLDEIDADPTCIFWG